eukprot:1144056-Pelagomonas_calceolata.AAC.1
MDVSIQAEVQTFTHPKFGTCVAAAANFAKGQVVLKEKPLLLVPADTYVPSTLSDLAARNDLGKISRDVFRPALVLASTPPDVRSSVLKELFIPDIDQDPSLQETTAYKVTNVNPCKPICSLSKHAQLTCALRYKSSDDGYGCHIAVRDIKNGDLLTTSYIDEEHLLCSTSARCDKIGTCSLEATKWDMRALQKWLIFINIHADGCICFARSCKLLQDFIRDKFMFTCCCGSCASADFFRCVAEALAKQLNWTDALIHGADVQEVGSPMKSICVHPMRLRGLPCPLCLPSGGRDAKAMSRLATDFALGQRPLPGTLFFDPSKVGQNRCLRKGPAQLVLKGKNSPRAVGKKAPDAMSQSINQVPLKQKVHTGKPWTCNSCSSALEDDPSRLGLPTKFKDYVLAEHGQRGLTIGEKTSFDPSHLERSLERQVLLELSQPLMTGYTAQAGESFLSLLLVCPVRQ